MAAMNLQSSLEKPMLEDYETGTTRTFPQDRFECDVVVVGAGTAGVCAAVAAARAGAETALITDRPVLGGSASSEIRVTPIGAANASWNLFARETGILEEIWLNIAEKAARSGIWRWLFYDEAYFDLVLAEPKLKLFLNTSVFDACLGNNGKIDSVRAVQLRSEKIFEFSGKKFIDCSGDGVVGYLAGADYRVGRESRDEFGEADAPLTSDRGTMGATLLFTTIDRGHDVPFKAPKWALDVREFPALLQPDHMLHRRLYRSINGHYYGFWWAEYGGAIDSIHDDDEVVMHTRRLIYGLWDYVKNSGKFDNVARQEIDWIGYLPGKRESRRLLGPVIVTGNDLLEQRDFDDRIGYAGWTVDTHPPRGYQDSAPASKHTDLPAVSDIPLRCLCSRNIDGLWFAGRNISASHEGLGSLRVIATCAVMGQAAGEAAAYAAKHNLTSNQVVQDHISEIQRLLVRNDQSIAGYRLQEEEDLSRTATVSASSEREVSAKDVVQYFTLTERLGLVLPVDAPQLESISFYVKAFHESELVLKVFATDDGRNYRYRHALGTFSQKINKDGWVNFGVNAIPGEGWKLFFVLEKNPAISIGCAGNSLPGVMGMTVEDDEVIGENTRYKDLSLIPSFRVTPDLRLFRAENLTDGYIRPLGLPHCWCSGIIDPAEPAWVALELAARKPICCAELVCDSRLNAKHRDLSGMVYPEIVRDYDLFAVTEGRQALLHRERGNIQRFRRHHFAATEADSVKLVVYRTWGSDYVALYDLRLYS